MPQNLEHQKLVDDLLFAFGSRKDVRCWTRNVGVAILRDGSVVKYGMRGETDIDGIVSPSGRRLAIEVKTGKAILSNDQVLWKNMIQLYGGIYILARDVNSALADFESQL